MNFVMHRDRTVVSTLGHAIRFEKGVPMPVPKEMWPEVQAQGAVPESELPEEDTTSKVPKDPEVRLKEIQAAFEMIVERNQREDFSAVGIPNSKALHAVLGWAVPVKERDAAWGAFMSAKKGE